MRLRAAIYGLVLVLSGASTALAQRTTREPLPDSDVPVAKAEVAYETREALGKGVTLARLNSGLTVLVQENHSAPVATVRCYLNNTGSAFEGKDLGAGLSHVLEHLVAGGSTTRRTKAEIDEIVDSLGGQTNAYTDDDVTCFYIDCPATGVDTAIELISDNMQHSIIPESEYVQEMGVVQRELEMGEADRTRVLYQMLKQLVYLEHPVRHPTIGYLPVVQNISRDDVLAFYKNRYVPQNMTFVVAGDVKTDAVLEALLARFKEFPRTTERFDVLPDEPPQASPRSARRQMEGPTTNFAVAWPTVAIQHPDLYALDMASFILTNGDSSRLVRRLKIDNPLAIAVDSVSNTPGFVRGWFHIATESEPATVDEIRKIVFEEIERLKTEPVTEAELARAKRQKAADHVFAKQTVESQAETLAQSYRATGDPLFDARYVENIQKVTAQQIVAAAKRYFVRDRLNTVTIDPLESLADPSSADSAEEAESPVTKKVLANGLTVLLKRQTTLPLVTIQAYARAGVVVETAQTSGLASLTTEMLERGTKKYTAAQIAEYFDSIGGQLVLKSQTNTSYLQSQVLKDDAGASLGYLHQILCEPTFPKEEFANIREIRLSQIASRAANPQTEIMDFFAKHVPAGNPYSRTALGDPAVVKSLTVDDCRKFHKTWFVPNNMVLSIFGDIDIEEMLKQIEGSFGKLPASKGLKLPEFSPQPELLTESAADHLQNQKKNTAMVLLAFPTPSIKDSSARDALDVLDALLTGGGSAGGRLHEELRGRQLVYYVFGMQMTGFAPGYFAFLAQSRPESVDEVARRIQAGLATIRNEGIPADEFEKIKAKLVIAHQLRNTTPAERAFQASIDELYGLGFDYEKSYPERIAKVTADDVINVARQYFEHGLLVTSSPEGQAK